MSEWVRGQVSNLDPAGHEQGEEDKDGCGGSHDVGNDKPGLPV